MDSKEAEAHLFKNAPKAREILKQAKTETRKRDRAAWWSANGPKRTQSKLP